MAYGPTRVAAWLAHAVRHVQRTPWTGHRTQGGRGGTAGGSSSAAPGRCGRRCEHGGAKGVTPSKGMEDRAHRNGFVTSARRLGPERRRLIVVEALQRL
jgi:hypothetical protein